jgi:hypothetical protein
VTIPPSAGLAGTLNDAAPGYASQITDPWSRVTLCSISEVCTVRGEMNLPGVQVTILNDPGLGECGGEIVIEKCLVCLSCGRVFKVESSSISLYLYAVSQSAHQILEAMTHRCQLNRRRQIVPIKVPVPRVDRGGVLDV